MQSAGLYAVERERLDFVHPPPPDWDAINAERRQRKAANVAESRLAVWREILDRLPPDLEDRERVAALLASCGS